MLQRTDPQLLQRQCLTLLGTEAPKEGAPEQPIDPPVQNSALAERSGTAPPEHHRNSGTPEKSRQDVIRGLEGHALPTKFSDQALLKLKVLPVQYFEDLVSGAQRIARRNGSDMVSASDVEAADRTLQSRPRRVLWTTVNTIGGLLAGAGIAQMITILAANENPSKAAMLLGVVPAIVGLVALGISIA